MRPSPRLSFLAAACTVAMMALPTVARTYEYTLTSAPDGWTFSVSGNTKFSGNGYCFANADAQMQTAEFDGPITNIVFTGYRTSSCNRQIKFTAGNVSETWMTGTLVDTSLSEFKVIELPALDDIRSFNLKSAGGSQNFYLKTVVVYIADPPPTIDTILDQEASTAGDLVVHFSVTSFEGDDPPTFSATAQNLDDPSATYSDDRFNFAPNYSVMRPGYYDFTFSPPEGFGPCSMRFTITATGRGGSASQSFECTFIEGAVPTPPQVWTPTLNPAFVLAGRTITLQVDYVEADGDQVTFTVTNTTCNGSYSIGESTGIFTFTPTLQDVSEYPHEFAVQAKDKDGDNDTSIRVVVFPVGTPKLTPIDDYTMAFGKTLFIDLEAEATEYVQGEYIDDPLISSNITIKAGTTAPEGEYVFEDGCLSFTPTTNDIGQTFIFTASATDLDGTTNQDFNVTVGLAAPVLKHCPVDDWTATSFTADIEEAVPGATSYTLRYIRHEDDGTPVTNTVSVASFPYVVSGLATTNYVYDVQAVRGATISAWSNAKSIDLHAYIAPTYAIPMTGTAHGTHHEKFDGLISSGSAYWYDARTIPGWYAASSSGSMSDVKYAANTGGSSGTGLFSCQVDDEAVTNRALAARADTQYDEFSFGVMFTNMCKYAVTNLHVSFTAMQFRRYNPISHLYFSYTRSNRLIDYNDPENIWTPVDTLKFSAPTQGSSARLYPPTEEPKSADIPFEGVNAIQPGEVIALRWYLDAKSNYPTLGIDDLEVSWRCAWPCHTVIMLQ